MIDQVLGLVPGPDRGASSSSDNAWQDVHQHKVMPMGPGPWWSNTCLHQHIGSNFIIFSHFELDTNWTSVVDCNYQGFSPRGSKLLFLCVYFCASLTAKHYESYTIYRIHIKFHTDWTQKLYTDRKGHLWISLCRRTKTYPYWWDIPDMTTPTQRLNKIMYAFTFTMRLWITHCNHFINYTIPQCI